LARVSVFKAESKDDDVKGKDEEKKEGTSEQERRR